MIPTTILNKNLRKTKRKQNHFRTQSSNLLKVDYSIKSRKKKSINQSHKRTMSSLGDNLVPLSGKTITIAPKIYSNQIFSDIYDEKGNHDRIIEFSTEADNDYNQMQHFISPELLQLPTVGRNLYSTKKILFY